MTVIATGFPTSESSNEKDENLRDILEEARAGDSDLDVPPFIRRLSKYRSNGKVETPIA